ncbi:MAG: signal peptide peptidase SppA, partial [Alphaproteobacteria bacterium]
MRFLRFLRLLGRWVWNILRVSHILVFGTLALVLLIALVVSLFAERGIRIPADSALEIVLEGNIVEQRSEIDPVSIALGGEDLPDELLLSDIVAALEDAAGDQRIKLVVLRLQGLLSAGPAALHRIGEAVAGLRKAGKPVLAYGDIITQPHYLVASHADAVYLNPSGLVEILGYGSFPVYFREALDKLRVSVNVFRVGEYKSAVEPLLRNDMSEAARTATRDFLAVLWRHYTQTVADARGAKGADLSGDFAAVPDKLRAVGGDLAQMALAEHLVDGLLARDAFDDLIAERLGIKADEADAHRVDLATYRAAHHAASFGKDRIAVIHAVGEILDGEQPAGTVGGDTLSALIERARRDDSVKAIVLRIDSPGGSAFASEVIRRALARAQADGKPVVASMGSVAASGGYWIAASADEIWAAPTTITGSIGIFGFIPTFERSLDAIGVHADGVGTTALAGQFALTRPLGEDARAIVQLAVEDGYRKFLAIVAEGRHMTAADIDAIAQGRVWAGETAHRLGLVDHLGNLQEAVDAAARLANLKPGT